MSKLGFLLLTLIYSNLSLAKPTATITSVGCGSKYVFGISADIDSVESAQLDIGIGGFGDDGNGHSIPEAPAVEFRKVLDQSNDSKWPIFGSFKLPQSACHVEWVADNPTMDCSYQSSANPLTIHFADNIEEVGVASVTSLHIAGNQGIIRVDLENKDGRKASIQLQPTIPNSCQGD